MKFEAEKGEHFFRSTLVQTLFYGVFSAWVLWHKEKPAPHRRLRLEGRRVDPPCPDDQGPLRAGRHPHQARPAGPGGSARLDRRRPQPRGPPRLLREIPGNPRRPVFLRALPRSLRPRTPQTAGRLVHSAGDRANTRSPAWTPCCARNWASPTAWPIRASSSSTPAAAPAPIWSRCCDSIDQTLERGQRRRRPCQL